MAGALAAPLLTRARSRYSGIKLRIVDGFSSTLAEWVQSGRLDLALLSEEGDQPALDSTPVFWEEVVLAGAGIGTQPIRPAELARIPLVLPSPSQAMRQAAERYARSHAIRLHVVYEVDAMPAIQALLRRGIACSLSSRAALYDTLSHPTLDHRPLEPRIERLVSLVRPQGHPITRAVEAIRELVVDSVVELVTSGVWPARLAIYASTDRFAHTEIETIGF